MKTPDLMLTNEQATLVARGAKPDPELRGAAGVGMTSLGQSIARALGIGFARGSLGVLSRRLTSEPGEDCPLRL
jgi:hypothetical protein